MTGQGKWAEAFGKAREMVGKMTLEEKVCLFFFAFSPVFDFFASFFFFSSLFSSPSFFLSLASFSFSLVAGNLTFSNR